MGVFSVPDSVPRQEENAPVQESTPTKPLQSVAPQASETSISSVPESGTDDLANLCDFSTEPPPNPPQTTESSNLVDLMDDITRDVAPPCSAATSTKAQPLLSFDEMMDGTFCLGTEVEPPSLVDLTASEQMTLSYQHALQHASGEELDDGQLLMTNGETLLKEGTQVRCFHTAVGREKRFSVFLFFTSTFSVLSQASEGYFSQSQEEEFGQSEESSAKPAPVFYNKPPGETVFYSEHVFTVVVI